MLNCESGGVQRGMGAIKFSMERNRLGCWDLQISTEGGLVGDFLPLPGQDTGFN